MTTSSLDRIRFVSQHFNDLQGLRTAFGLGLVLIGLGSLHLVSTWPLLLPLSLAFNVAGILLVNRWGRLYYQRRFGEVERLPALYGAELSELSVYSPAGPVPFSLDRKPVNPVVRWFLIPVACALALFVILRAVSPPAALLAAGSSRTSLLYPLVVETGSPGSLTQGGWEPLLAQGEYLLCGACFVGVWLWRGRRLSQSYYLIPGLLLLGIVGLGACLGTVMPMLWDLGVARIGRYFLPALASFWLADLLCGALLAFVGLLDHWQLVRALKPALGRPS
jgi:hypothetical protein